MAYLLCVYMYVCSRVCNCVGGVCVVSVCVLCVCMYSIYVCVSRHNVVFFYFTMYHDSQTLSCVQVWLVLSTSM